MVCGKNSENCKCGFSLLEVVAVVVILAICVAMCRVIFSYRSDSIKVSITKQELAFLNCILEDIKLTKGAYPAGKSKSIDDNAIALYNALSDKLSTIGTKHLWTVKDGKLLDPWKRPYVYRCESPNDGMYVLFSMGPNGYMDEDELIDDVYSR